MLENVNNFLTEIIDEDIKNGLSERIHTAFRRSERLSAYRLGKGDLHQLVYRKKYNGLFNLRYDDTNPVKEDTEYVDSIWGGHQVADRRGAERRCVLRLGLL